MKEGGREGKGGRGEDIIVIWAGRERGVMIGEGRERERMGLKR